MRSLIVASLSLVVLAGPAQAQRGLTEPVEGECPPAFIGAEVKASVLRDGVSLEFRTPNLASLTDMRMQLREVAQMLEDQGTEVQTTGAEDELVEFPPVDIAVSDIARGARITVRAARFQDVPVLRELAFGFAEFWASSPCSANLVALR